MSNKTIISTLKHYGKKGMKWGIINENKLKPQVKSAGEKLPERNRPKTRILQTVEKIPGMSKKLQEQTLKEIQDDKNNRIQDWKDVPRFDPKQESIDIALRKVNEGYILAPLVTNEVAVNNKLVSIWDGSVRDFANNCPSATMSYELRRRGYDVEAGLTGGATFAQIAAVYNLEEKEVVDSLKTLDEKGFAELVKSIEAMGPGARGFCLMTWAFGGGHISAFEVDSKGKVIFIDAQTQVKSNDPTIKLRGATNPADYYKRARGYGIIRTDNREINLNAVKNWTRHDDKKVPIGGKKLNYIDPKKIEKGKAYVKHTSLILASDFCGKE